MIDQTYSCFEYDPDSLVEFPENLVAIAGGLIERNIIIAIDMQNHFYKVDIEKQVIVFVSDKRDEGQIGDSICIMNSREENWLACSKWTYEQN